MTRRCARAMTGGLGILRKVRSHLLRLVPFERAGVCLSSLHADLR